MPVSFSLLQNWISYLTASFIVQLYLGSWHIIYDINTVLLLQHQKEEEIKLSIQRGYAKKLQNVHDEQMV